MHKLFKSFGFSLTGLGAIFMFNVANAAETGRAAYNNVNSTNRATFNSQQRMPTMSILPANTTGNVVVNTGTAVVPKCPDGSVANSEYKVENCMDDVLACVNNGALPGGLNDLFNEDLRNSIFNGMNLCSVQVDKCITDVRKNCKNVYANTSDFWIDFNSRKIQPEYYSFVLRKTGLTPNQAENTCWLLDKNTYGSSFDAISNSGSVTSEYNNKIGAYNNQGGGSLTKNLPQGVTVNNNNPGVDGQRGHYARWDAATGECLIRVAAYNKDTQIKNSWLFGTLGNDEPAEVWKAAGNSFSCGKDLFGFGLMNNTKTTAVVGVGGGTLVGAGVGAIAGHGKREFDCTNNGNLDKLTQQLRESGKSGILRKYLVNSDISDISGTITKNQCKEIVSLYGKYKYKESFGIDTKCVDSAKNGISNAATVNTQEVKLTRADFHLKADSVNADQRDVNSYDWTKYYPMGNGGAAVDLTVALTPDEQNSLMTDGNFVTRTVSVTNATGKACPTYYSLQVEGYDSDVVCNAGDYQECVTGKELSSEIKELGQVFSNLDVLLEGEKSNMLASTAIGAGAGAAAGGLATAITAFVEKNNINCRVGDGLQKVDYGKSYSIGSLKDFYVKWNLRLPDTIMPTSTATDCVSWTNACATLKDLNQCATAQVNYKPANSTNTILVNTACVVSGSACTVNHPVAVSNGACQ